jgi:predicted rRNA methylase YqxC with S4 and FtsJ domains
LGVPPASLPLTWHPRRQVVPAVRAVLRPAGRLVVLVKPQFEAARADVGGGGVVRDPAVHRAVLARVVAGAPRPREGRTRGNERAMSAEIAC